MLIPAGSRVLGETKPVQAFGETRLAVVFHRLVLPDGRDLQPRSVHRAQPDRRCRPARQVNQHYWSTFGASAAVGLISGLAQFLGTGGFSRGSGDRIVVIGGGVGDAAAQATDTGHEPISQSAARRSRSGKAIASRSISRATSSCPRMTPRDRLTQPGDVRACPMEVGHETRADCLAAAARAAPRRRAPSWPSSIPANLAQAVIIAERTLREYQTLLAQYQTMLRIGTGPRKHGGLSHPDDCDDPP